MALRQMHAKSLWKFNKFEITKIQWKSTAVPRLTYANSVTVMSRQTRKNIETTQREAGKWALGQPCFNIASEFIEGELGWSSFEAREAKSKILYFARINNMPNTSWPKIMLEMTKICNINTAAHSRMLELKQQYNCQDINVLNRFNGQANMTKFKSDIEHKITETQHQNWCEGMSSKSSLTRYRDYKNKRGIIEHLYDNSRGSTLLASARAGFLRTRIFRSRFEDIDTVCTVCRTGPETIGHIILECQELADSDKEVRIRLGLHEESKPHIVERTKRTLERWERHSFQEQ